MATRVATNVNVFPSASVVSLPAAARLDSVDLMRGIIIALMALDHVRDYFTHLRFAPEQMNQTWPALFATRFVTHFCAPWFFFLAGTGAYLYMQRGKSPAQLSRFLWTRGLWLVFLELTVIAYAWSFTLTFHWAAVIWALGWSMVIMAALVRLPVKAVAAFGLVLIFGHNLLDGIRTGPMSLHPTLWQQVWTVLHVPGVLFWFVPGENAFFVAYVLIPWVGVMAAGYAFGTILQYPPEKRRKIMVAMGLAAILLFCALRATNVYGNPHRLLMDRSFGDFHAQPTAAMTVVAFLNTEKYPPSLDYLLMTLGPGLLALALFDKYNDKLARGFAAPLVVIGRVPLFFYTLHIFLIHLAAIAVAVAFHQPARWLLHGGIFFGPPPNGYGHNLPFIYLVWISVCVALYLPCRWFAKMKQHRRDLWWLSYM